MHPNRAESLAAYPLIHKYNADVFKRQYKLDKRNSSVPIITENALGELFAMSGAAPVALAKKKKAPAAEKPIPEIERYAWPTLDNQALMEKLDNEKKAFGFYFSGHPMTHFKTQLGDLKTCEPISELMNAYPSYDDLHLIAGVVSDMKTFDTKNGKMVKGTISDGTTSTEFLAFSDAYTPVKEWFKKDTFALFTIQVKEDKFKGGQSYMATEIRSMPEAQLFLADRLNISIEKEQVSRLKEIVNHNQPKQGQKSVPIMLWHPHENSHVKSTEPIIQIPLNTGFLDQLKQEFGKHVKLGFPTQRLQIKAPPKQRGAYRK